MKDSLQRYFELLWAMTEKELRARYKHTVFGFFWLVANPLLQMLVIGFVFTFFMKEPVQYYYYHLFIGLLVWNFFSLSLSKATPSIVYERSLVKKAYFPKSVIPISIVLSNLIHFLVALILYILPVLFLQTFDPIKLPFFILGILQLFLLTIGLCLLTSALNVRYRDVAFFVQAALIIWFYATPIIYSITHVPREYIWIWRLNPLTSILQLSHYTFLKAAPPGPLMLLSNFITTLCIFVLGIKTFSKKSPFFDDWL